MDKLKISINFKSQYEHIYNYLKSKDNISAYICRIVEADIKKEEQQSCLEEKIIEIVNRLLQDGKIVFEADYISNTISNEDNDLIKNLF
jgi:hypothetical protein